MNCTHPRENEKCVQFFFLHECFGAIIPFEKPKIENPSHSNWINLQRDEHGNWIKKKITLICSNSELFYMFYQFSRLSLSKYSQLKDTFLIIFGVGITMPATPFLQK